MTQPIAEQQMAQATELFWFQPELMAVKRAISSGTRAASRTPSTSKTDRPSARAHDPPGLLQFVAEVGEPAQAPRLPGDERHDTDKLVALAGKYRLEVVGAPLD